MSQPGKFVIYFTLIASTIIVPLRLSCQQRNQPPVAAAPVPAQIAAARRVFIANAGTDVDAQEIFFKRSDEPPEEAYNRFYSAMQSWNRYELVAAPSDADLVFELRFTAPKSLNGTMSFFEPQFDLNIVDAKSHFLLWSMTGPVEPAYRKATWRKNFDAGLDALMERLKKLSPASGEPDKK